MRSVWKWVRWLFTGNMIKVEDGEVEVYAPPQSNSMFSTDTEDLGDDLGHNRERQLRAIDDRMKGIADSLPRVSIPASGDQKARVAHAMDSAEYGEDSSGGPKFNNSQPNLSDAILGFFLNGTFIGHQLAALLSQHWLIDKACTIPARDAVRHWFEIKSADGDDVENAEVIRLLKRADRQYGLRKNCEEFIRMGRVFGIRILLFKVESTDPDYYEKPFNIDGITPNSYKGMVQVDPYWCAPELDEAATSKPDTMNFYEPTHWLINGKRYHRSHLVIFRNSPPPDILKPSYLYGGVPVPQKIVERVYAAERTANEGPQLAMTKRSTFLKTDVVAAMQKGGKFIANLARWVSMRDNYNVKVMGLEDDMTQVDTSLADLDAVIMTQYQIVAAASNMPATKLFGTPPKGFNATGEYEEASYHEELESIQTNDLTSLCERHHAIAMYSYVVPLMRKFDPAFQPLETSVNWEALDSPTAKEYAEIELIKAQTGVQLSQSGAIDGYDERDRVSKDPNGSWTGIAPATRPPEADEDGDEGVTPGVVGAQVETAQANEQKAKQTPAPAAAHATDSMDDPVLLVTNQSFLDPDIVQAKRDIGDYNVQVSPVLTDPITGRRFRIVIDGHHSLAAARADMREPNLQESEFSVGDYHPA